MRNVVDASELARRLDEPDFDIFEFEAALANFVNKYTSKSIGPLLTVFRDDFEFDEALCSILHAIESFDTAVYCREIVQGLKDLENSSNRWLTIIIQRILNSEKDYISFRNLALSSDDPETKKVLATVVMELREVSSSRNWKRLSEDFDLGID